MMNAVAACVFGVRSLGCARQSPGLNFHPGAWAPEIKAVPRHRTPKAVINSGFVVEYFPQLNGYVMHGKRLLNEADTTAFDYLAGLTVEAITAGE
jgi:hypothetical protein